MEVVFLKLLNMSITAGWLVLAVIVLRLVFRKAPKALRVIMWALVGLRLICPISFESILSLIPSAETVPMDVLNLETPAINSGITELNEAINPIISEKVTSIQVITFAASVIWIVGMMAMLLYGVISYYRIHIKVREAILLKDNIWLSDRILTPFILGVFYPRIYLPCSMNEQDMDYVIAHEKAHLSRRDHWWKPIGFILLTVYWFNPVLWIAYILLCRDIEFACDEKVIKTMGTDVKKPYSNALINCSIHRKTISVCPVAFGEVGVKGRIKSVLNYKKPSFWIVAAAIIVCLCISVCFLTNPTENNPEIVTDTLVSENNSETITDTPVPESNVGEVSDSDEIYQIEKELTDLNNQESQKYEQEKQLQVDLAEQAKEEIKKQVKNKDKDAGIIKKNKKKKTKDKEIAPTNTPVVPTDTPVAPPPEVKPTRTPRPTVKPTAAPRPTPIQIVTFPEYPKGPYGLDFDEETVKEHGNSSVIFYTDMRSVTLAARAKNGGAVFSIPSDDLGFFYDTVTITYKNAINVGAGFGWSDYNGGNEVIMAENGIFADATEGTVTLSVGSTVNAIRLFCNDTDAIANGAARVTITSMTFSYSK